MLREIIGIVPQGRKRPKGAFEGHLFSMVLDMTLSFMAGGSVHEKMGDRMGAVKTKSIKRIEEKMENIEGETMRYQVLQSARNFKTSWIDLGQSLASVWKDKLYREWGYNNFDTYAAREIGLRKQTALKLLRSYFFLEKEEPDYLRKDRIETSSAATVPTYEAVDLLRLASKKSQLDKEDYARLKKNLLENGKDVSAVKKDLTTLIRERDELEPDEAFKKKRRALIMRLVGSLEAIRREVRVSKILPEKLTQDIEKLAQRIRNQL